DANTHGAVRWDLNWNMQIDDRGLRIDAHYNRDLFDAVRAEGWLDQYVSILEEFVDGPDDAGMVTATRGAWDGAHTLSAQVARHAAMTPEPPAVSDSRGIVDYQTLDSQAAELAGRLVQAGVRAGDHVAFRLERGLGPVVAILAIMRLGAAFVPLDAEHPDAHHAAILQDCGATVLLRSEEHTSEL